MNYLHLLSLCLLAPAFLHAADLPKVESVLTGLKITEKAESENIHTMLMKRQLHGKAFPKQKKEAMVAEEKKRIIEKARQCDRSCIPFNFADARLYDRPKMTVLSIARIKRVADESSYGLFVMPIPLAFIARLEKEGVVFEGLLRPFNHIDVDDFKKPEMFRFMGVYSDKYGDVAGVSIGNPIPAETFTPEEVQVVRDGVVGVQLHNTGTEEIDCGQLKEAYPNLGLVVLPVSVSFSSKVHNAYKARGTGVDIIYRDVKSNYDELSTFSYPYSPSAAIKALPAYGAVENAFKSHETRALGVFNGIQS